MFCLGLVSFFNLFLPFKIFSILNLLLFFCFLIQVLGDVPSVLRAVVEIGCQLRFSNFF